jgi:hypothetical protein
MHIYRLNSAELRVWRDRDARETLKHKINARHGDAQVRAPNGRILGTARSPERSGRIPIERSLARGAHHVVSPRECICREWQKPAGKEHEHHPICTHKAHWAAQQAKSPDMLRDRAVLGARQPGHAAGPSVATTALDDQAPPTERSSRTPEAASFGSAGADDVTKISPEQLAVPAPPDCTCRAWAGGREGKHHPLCQFRERGERDDGETHPVLVDLETGAVAREAAPEEIEASRAKAKEDGVGAIELSDGKLYYARDP